MTQRPSTADRELSVPYSSRRVGVVRLARHFLKRASSGAAAAPRPATAAEADARLPELTDAWFEETIRLVDDASHRVKPASRR